MVDCSHTEIAAFTIAFPLSHTVFSAFHWEQAWSRWLTRKKNEVADNTSVKKLMRQVASSTRKRELEMALGHLKQSPQRQHNKQLQAYITQNWLPVLEMWVKMYG